MSTTYPDTNYGPRRPEPIEKHADLVVRNTNIRELTREDEQTGEVETYYLADAEMMTYPEYSEIQDEILAQQVAINEEHDELFAMIIEGEL